MISTFQYNKTIKIHLKGPHILPIVMHCNDVKKILKFLYEERINNQHDDSYTYKAQTRNIAIIKLLFATGIRVSELCQLQNQDIDLQHGIIKVYGKGKKDT